MKYQYKLVIAKQEKRENGRYNVWDIEKQEPSEWRFVAFIAPDAMLFEKVIQEPEHTFTVPNSTGTFTEPQPEANKPVVLN